MGSNEERHHTKQLMKNGASKHSKSTREEEDDDDDDDDGPPPGFDSLPLNSAINQNKQPEIDNDDDDDDGPPPGFQSICLENNKRKQQSFEDEDDDDGPPPGFHSIHVTKQDDDVSMSNSYLIPVGDGLEPNSHSQSKSVGFQSIPVIKDEKSGKINSFSSYVKEDENGGDVSGLGLHSSALKGEEKVGHGSELGFRSVCKKGDESVIGFHSITMNEDGKEEKMCGDAFQSILKKGVGEEEEQEDDDGPPPGWGSMPPPRPLVKSLEPCHQLPSAGSSRDGFEPSHVKEEEKVKDGSQSVPMEEDKKQRDESEIEPQSFPIKDEEKGSSPAEAKEEDDDDGSEGPPPGWDSFPSQRPSSDTQVPPQPRLSATSSGKAQMVCGTCRRLLSYTIGSRFVQCSCCQTVNLVLEEHQIGQVKCRGCAVLLMYPYGAPSVQCSSCLFVTKIGVQNKRPSLSVQQSRQHLPANPVH